MHTVFNVQLLLTVVSNAFWNSSEGMTVLAKNIAPILLQYFQVKKATFLITG